MITYGQYQIDIDNSQYVCGDLLILTFKDNVKNREQEHYCMRYIDHIIGSNGILYLLCKTHISSSDHVIIACNRSHKYMSYISVNGGDMIYEDNGLIYVSGLDIIYTIDGLTIKNKRLKRDG